MNRDELARLERYLQKTFRLDTIQVRKFMRKDDMAEIYIGDESIGLIYRLVDEDDGDVSYDLRMAILEMDLEEAG